MPQLSNNHASLTISGTPRALFPGKIKPSWVEAAEAKGFEIVARIIDRLHLALRCRRCSALSAVRLYTLVSARPLCHACILAERRKEAEAAGIIFLRRTDDNRHYGIFRAGCGHEIRRQFALIRRVAAGETKIRCETCHASTERAEAEAQGWNVIGPDPDGDPNYREYSHSACGHRQRIARANMQSGRVGCGGCGELWTAAQSYIYMMKFTLASSREVVKVGFSKDPESRLYYQLLRDPTMPCAIVRKVLVSSGQQAIRLEKRLHVKLRHAHPNAIVEACNYQDQIKVKSEIYDRALAPIILAELDAMAANAESRAP